METIGNNPGVGKPSTDEALSSFAADEFGINTLNGCGAHVSQTSQGRVADAFVVIPGNLLAQRLGAMPSWLYPLLKIRKHNLVEET